MQATSRHTAAALMGVILGLLLVGVVSGTTVRHSIQVLPAAVALALMIRGLPWAPYAALPIFLFWLVIMIFIWLFLLGWARITTGNFTPSEIGLTFVIGASCVVGLIQSLRASSTARPAIRIACVILFAALQVTALWLSLRPAFEHL